MLPTEAHKRPPLARVTAALLAAGLVLIISGCLTTGSDPGNHPSVLRRFPWYPPVPTTFAQVPEQFGLTGGEGQTYGDLARRLETALNNAGYGEKAYYSVPGGFALACRLEQIDGDWKPLPPPHRWGDSQPPLQVFSLWEYLERLFLAQPGHYRLLVFIVTDEPFGFTNTTVTPSMGQAWLFGGVTKLPSAMAQSPASTDTGCFALVYEFKKAAAGSPAAFVSDETVGALIQLQRGGVF